MRQFGKYTLLAIIFVIMVFPLLWMFYLSLTSVQSQFTIQNFIYIFSSNNFGLYLFNSLFVGITVTVGNILFCFMCGYALARRKVPGSKFWLYTVLIVLMVPVHIVIIPIYILMNKLGLYDSYWALILPWLVNPIGIFLIKQYISTLPESLEEAARIDGAGEMKILFRIVMPLCKPALAILAIQVFMTNWNSFLFPFILTSSETYRTLPVALALLLGYQSIDWHQLMAGSVVAVLPILVLFLIFQRQIISDITAGAFKQ
ncbi:MAG: carbohydrate ABC transporter permease [candidate division Zixibacteria bacterium]|nr:carbohydrate ABC transporter permease [candidate division Zixibacteria bacterium]